MAHHEKGKVVQQKKEYLFKLLIVGDAGAGKTSLVRRLVDNVFSMHYKTTVGVDFSLKRLQWDENTVVQLQLWDIAGQERFSKMTRVYYREAVGAFVVFDVVKPESFEAVPQWKMDIDSKVWIPGPDGKDVPIPVVLLANKCDLIPDYATQKKSEHDTFCDEQAFIGWCETSAKENINIEKSLRMLVSQILENEKLHPSKPDVDEEEEEEDTTTVKLKEKDPKTSSEGCSC